MITETRRRVRPALLVLLWVWAICIFTVVDLFLNVPELDSIRPRAPLYRGMRQAAHRMVGVPLPARVASVRRETPDEARTRLFCELTATRSLRDLRMFALEETDTDVRLLALRRLVELSGPEAREVLLAIARDPGEEEWMRVRTALLVGHTGAGALAALDTLLGPGIPDMVRTAAASALGNLDTPDAARRALAFASGPPSRMSGAAIQALARFSDPEAVALLAAAAADPTRPAAARAAMCHALDAESLARLRADPATPGEVRDAATDALARHAVESVGELERTGARADLRAHAIGGITPIVRVVALRACARGRDVDVLRDVLADPEQDARVRGEAARLLGRTGAGALPVLEAVFGSDAPDGAKEGAVLGLAEIGNADAARRALALADGPRSSLRDAAVRALGSFRDAEAAPVLRDVAQDRARPADMRIAAVHALAEDPAAQQTLTDILADRSAPPALRAATVTAVAMNGGPGAMDALDKACADPAPEVARLAQRTKNHLLRAR